MNSSKISAKLANYIKPNTLFIFSKSSCPYCDKSKDLLKSLEVPFNSIEVDNTPELENDKEFIEELHTNSGFRTYPKVYIGMKCIGGFTDLEKLYKNMKLFKILKEEKIRFADDENYKF
jgi:glutaredoxin 3